MEPPPQSPAVSDISARRNKGLEDGKTWASAVTPNNAWEKLVLSLDGGGIRGYSELLILQEIMSRVVAWEFTISGRQLDVNTILPCHYFDYMWGTSTGGLICIMLGRLRMSVPQALAVYRRMGSTIFGRRKSTNMGGFNFLADKFPYKEIEKAVKQICQDHCKLLHPCNGEDKLLWPDQTSMDIQNDRDLCQAVVITARTSTRGDADQAQPLRTYNYIHYDDPAKPPDRFEGHQDLDLKIWEAARATSAAPTYFKMFEKRDSEGHLRRYKDGGTLLNNPAERALEEVGIRDGGNEETNVHDGVALLLSIGTGLKQVSQFARRDEGPSTPRRPDIPRMQALGDKLYDKLVRPLQEKTATGKHALFRYTQGEDIHDELRRRQARNEHTWYRRLNVDQSLGDMGLGDWRPGKWLNPATNELEDHPGGATLTDMETLTNNYLKRTQLRSEHWVEWSLLPSEHIDQVAERLVRHRTERRNAIKTEEDRKIWHTYQGRYVTGIEMDPWDDDSCDKPYQRPTGEGGSETSGSAASKDSPILMR